MKKKIISALAVLLALVMLSTGCSLTGDDVTDPSVVSLRYEGGKTQGREFKECVPAGTKLATDDTLYPYPTTQRQDMWDAKNKAADHGDLSVTDNSGVTLGAQVNVAFFLNTSCEPVKVGDKTYKGGTLQAFHELIGKTRHAYFNDDGSYGDGWINAMNYYISPQVESYLADAARQYGAEALWLNKDNVRQTIAQGLQDALPKMVNDNMETDLEFYKNFKVTITSFTPDAEFLQLYKDRQAAAIKAQTAQDNAAAQIAEAQAATQVAEAQANTLQAEIKGYGSVEAYLQQQAIDKGINPFQPSGSVITSGGK